MPEGLLGAFDRNVPEFTGGPSTPAAAGTTSVSPDDPRINLENSPVPVEFDPGDIDMGGLGADAPAPEFDLTGGIDPSQLNRGGKVQSFMNIKK